MWQWLAAGLNWGACYITLDIAVKPNTAGLDLDPMSRYHCWRYAAIAIGETVYPCLQNVLHATFKRCGLADFFSTNEQDNSRATEYRTKENFLRSLLGKLGRRKEFNLIREEDCYIILRAPNFDWIGQKYSLAALQTALSTIQGRCLNKCNQHCQ